mmetsp:Transcript_22417/g.21555  ORF Transcript_22417/g.21555 Transcript_22417/m.21555 type:complete len:101 (-) Transcript_22417:110-412(-)
MQKYEARINHVLERLESERLNNNITDFIIKQGQIIITQLANATTDVTYLTTTVNLLKIQLDNLQVGRGTTGNQIRYMNTNNTSYYCAHGRTINENHKSPT